MSTSQRYSSEVCQRTVHMVFDHEGDYPSQWAVIGAIAPRSVARRKLCDAGAGRSSVMRVAGKALRPFAQAELYRCGK